MTAQDSERASRRRARLKAELADEGVDLGVDVEDPVYELVLDEIAYSRQPPVHEGCRNSYGALLFTPEDFSYPYGLGDSSSVGSLLDSYRFNEPERHDIMNLRQICDGRRTFLARCPGEPNTLFEFVGLADELRLSQFRSAIAVQRSPLGVVKVYAPKRLYTFDQGDWHIKSYARGAEHGLFKMFFQELPPSEAKNIAMDTLRALASFCLHVLSPRHIGATLVWRPLSEGSWVSNSYTDGGHTPAVRCRLNSSHEDSERVATLLSVIDGACLVGPGGEVQQIKARLNPSAEALRLVKAEGGLRHTSAKRYSFDDPHSLVFVVSHDGPVTVYSDGMNIIQLKDGPIYLSRFGVARAEWPTKEHINVPCTGCNRVLCVGLSRNNISVPGCQLICPICTSTIPTLATAPEDVWPLKPWLATNARHLPMPRPRLIQKMDPRAHQSDLI